MASIFAARARYMRGQISRHEYNTMITAELARRWSERVPQTEPAWQWLCGVAGAIELKKAGAI